MPHDHIRFTAIKAMSATPTVSVVLPTFNRANLLPRAVDSVLAQSFSDIELLVVDDGSTDDTERYVRGLDDARVHYIRTAANRGQAAARNEGIRRSRARWIAFQDSDDEWVADKLKWQLAAMAANPRAAAVYGDLLRHPVHGEPFLIAAPEVEPGRLLDDRRSAYATFGIGIQTAMFRREALETLQGFDEQMRCFEDLDLFLRVLKRWPMIRVPHVLVHYHETDGVSKNQLHEHAARRLLLRRYAVSILFRRPSWFREEWKRIRAGLPLGA